MFASFRLELSPTQFGSEGSMVISNTLQLPNDPRALHTFKIALLDTIEKQLPEAFNSFLTYQELRNQLQQRLSDEASLLSAEPPEESSSEDLAEASPVEEEWLERYQRQF